MKEIVQTGKLLVTDNILILIVIKVSNKLTVDGSVRIASSKDNIW